MPRLKTIALSTAFAATAAFALSHPASSQTYEWKLTSYVPVKSGTWNNYMKRFIDAVHLMTNGQVKIKGFGVGVLAGPFDAWSAVQKKTADIGYNYPGFALNADPANGIFAGMVGGMPMEEFMHWYIGGDGTKLLNAMRNETQKLHSVVTGFGSTEIFLHSHKKITTIDDLKGMKIRTAGAWADILKQLGASATVLPPADIYTALERKVIDATEFVTPATNIKLGFHKIAKFIVVPGIHSPAHVNEAVFRLEEWNKLPKTLRDQITAAGAYAGMQSAIQIGVQDLSAMEQLQKGRNEWSQLTPETVARIEALGREWSKDQAEKQAAKGNMWMKRVSESYWGFYDRWKKLGTYRHN